jgi:hypothetical protein
LFGVSACFQFAIVCRRFVAYALSTLACVGLGCLVCSLLSKRFVILFW